MSEQRAFFFAWLGGTTVGLSIVALWCFLLVGCGPHRRTAPPVDLVATFPEAQRITAEPVSAKAEVRRWEDAYIRSGRPHPGPVHVRVIRAAGISPAVLPAGTAVPGARAGTWAATGDIDVSDPIYVPHELLHSAMRSWEAAYPEHGAPWWLGWQTNALLEPGSVP